MIRKVKVSMDEQKKYEVIKGLTNHPDSSKERDALTLDCTVRHINRMLAGDRVSGTLYMTTKGANPRIPSRKLQKLL